MKQELLYQVALTMVPHIGPVQAKILLQHCEAEEVFKAKKQYLEKIGGIGPARAAAIKSFTGFSRAEEELMFLDKYKISPLFLTDDLYPKRLLNCYDPPTLLYYKGNADLNASRMVSIIGTRRNTEYGKQVTDELVRELANHQVSIISGLAFGVDAIAHRAALRNELPTVGVLAHGLDKLYPPEHSGLAREMLDAGGGLLTEFRSGTKPDKHHFPSRNRVVAGLCDATIVVETDLKGGSMITAELANGYNRDVFAVPGRTTDLKSAGCNYLVGQQKAQLLGRLPDFAEFMGWKKKEDPARKKIQQELFIELTTEERKVLDLIREHDPVSFDEIRFRSNLSNSSLAAAMLSLEIQNVIVSLPGKIYRLS